MYYDLLEQVRLHDQDWYKIKADEAFPFVIGDWYKGYADAYMKYVDKRNVVVQAGGFCGIYPKLFSQMFGIVYTFEPDPLNFFCLTMNCQSDNIVKFQAALGDTHQMVMLSRNCPTNAGMNTVGPTNGLGIPTMRIDDLGLSDCSLIQLDTEGYEHIILHGAVETIRKFGPVISVEDNNLRIESLLLSFGYKPMIKIDRDTIFAR